MTDKLQPFDKVLVRNSTTSEWQIDLFGHERGGYTYTTGDRAYMECVPYEGNEELLGTTFAAPSKCKLKFGDKVKVSDDMQNWYDGIFCCKRNKVYMAMTLNKGNTVTWVTGWTYCVSHEW